jgi:hypothetical protein
MPRIVKYSGKPLPEIYFTWAEEIERLGYNYHEAMQAILDHGSYGNALDWVRDHPMSQSLVHAVGIKKFIQYPRRERAGDLLEEHKIVYENMIHSPVGIKEFFSEMSKVKQPKKVNCLGNLGLDDEKRRQSELSRKSRKSESRSTNTTAIDPYAVVDEGIVIPRPLVSTKVYKSLLETSPSKSYIESSPSIQSSTSSLTEISPSKSITELSPSKVVTNYDTQTKVTKLCTDSASNLQNAARISAPAQRVKF